MAAIIWFRNKSSRKELVVLDMSAAKELLEHVGSWMATDIRAPRREAAGTEA